jgi:hypothetical protein
MGGWEPVAQDDGDAPPPRDEWERTRVACTVLLMTGVGITIGVAFVLAQRALGMDA